MNGDYENISNEEAADRYLRENHSMADNDFQNALNIAVYKAYVAACEWKDKQNEIKQKEAMSNYLDQVQGHYTTTTTL